MASEDLRLQLDLIFEGSKERPEALTDWEMGFVTSTEQRVEKWGDNVTFSIKQRAVLDRLYQKVVEG